MTSTSSRVVTRDAMIRWRSRAERPAVPRPHSAAAPPGPARRTWGSGSGTGSPTAGPPGWAGRRRAGSACAVRSSTGSGQRDRRQQRLRVGVRGPVVDVLDVPDLGDPAEVHDRDPVGDVPDHGQVVRHEQVGQPQPVLQLLEQVDHAGLDGHVERRDRLVEHQQLRARARARGRCRCAGAGRRRSPAGSGRRASASSPTRSQQLARPAAAALAREPVRAQRLGDDVADRHAAGPATASGSWKTTCTSRRSCLARGLVQRGDVPAEHDDAAPLAAPAARGSACSVVVLPQPDSPTRPSVSPSRMSKLMPSTAWTVPTRRLNTAPFSQRVVPDQVVDLAAPSRARSRGTPDGIARRRSRAPGRRRRPVRSRCSISRAADAGRAAPAADARPAAARSSSQASTCIGQRGANGQPGGSSTGDGRVALDRHQRLPSGRSSRGTEPSSPIVYGIRGPVVDVVHRAAARPAGPRT